MDVVSFMMKIFLCFSTTLLLISCAQQPEPSSPKYPSGIVPKPESKEMRAGEKVNMMMLMEAESMAEEMDEVIVIPPKDKKTQPQ